MVTKKPPKDLKVNDHLEVARPMTVEEFREVKSGDVSEEELGEEKREFYDKVTGLAKNIKNNTQYHQVLCRSTNEGTELITGYRRYLACLYCGKAVECKIVRKSEGEILNMIYSENESRSGLDPHSRAVVIAKNMGRWDEENEQLLPEDHEDADEDAQTLVEFAEENGINRGQVYQQLSPLRQNMTMREEFGDEITETSMKLIERIADNKEEQYTLAQAFYRSTKDTHSGLQSTYKIAKRKVKEGEANSIIETMCRALIGFRSDDVKAEYKTPEERKSAKHKRLEDMEKDIKEREEREKSNAGHSFPTANDATENTSPEPDVEIGGPEQEEPDVRNPEGSGGGGTEEGVGVLPTKNEQPHSMQKIEDIEIPAGDVAQLIREECHDRDKDVSDFVTEIVKVHFRREGMLTDTPEAATMTDD